MKITRAKYRTRMNRSTGARCASRRSVICKANPRNAVVIKPSHFLKHDSWLLSSATARTYPGDSRVVNSPRQMRSTDRDSADKAPHKLQPPRSQADRFYTVSKASVVRLQ